LYFVDEAMDVEGIPTKKQSGPSFVTEIFYLTYFSLHIGVLRIIPRYQSAVAQCNELKHVLMRMNEQQRNWGVRLQTIF